MNRLPSDKARDLYRLFAYGHGQRESAKLAKVSRNATARHYRLWLASRPQLQQAYDALWDGDAAGFDAIVTKVQDDLALAMGDCWLDDQDEKQTVKSGWHAGYDKQNDAERTGESVCGRDQQSSAVPIKGEDISTPVR